MSKPEVGAKFPAVMELEPGTYFWCQCGKSKDHCWCDGSHAGTPFRPIKVEIVEKKKVAICQCKQTQGQPFCDGAHRGC